MTRRPLAAGIDLGGTKIAAGVFAGDGTLRGDLAVRPTEARGPAATTLANLLSAVEDALATASVAADDLDGIGVGTTGPLDPRRGVLLEPDNLPNLFDFPLAARLTERFGPAVTMTNDGNCFALSEALYGAGRGEDIVLGVTLGTGCGVGVVIKGRILEGTTANTGEVYRALVGERTFDEVLSGRGLERCYRERAGVSLPGREIGLLADAGDRAARDAFERFGERVARGLGLLAAVVDPGIIVLGGSVSCSFGHFDRSLRRDFPRYVAPACAERLRIECSGQGDTAGARGAAALVFSGGRLA